MMAYVIVSKNVSVLLVSLIVNKLKILSQRVTSGPILVTNALVNSASYSGAKFGSDSNLSLPVSDSSASFSYSSISRITSGCCARYCCWLILILLATSAKILYLGLASPCLCKCTYKLAAWVFDSPNS